MKKVGIVLVGIVILVGVIYFLPKEEKEVLIEEKENTNTSLAFYLEQEDGNFLESTNLPQTGYTLNTEKSVCTNNATPVWKENKLYLNNLKDKGTSCYLYFNIYEPNAKEVLLSHYDTVLTRTDFSTTVTDTTTGTIYKSLDETQYDNDGEVYYFAGNPTDNWVKFGGFYWRIIRINGNGSIRLIFNGTSTSPVGEITQIGSDYYSSGDDNAYVGYMYELGQVHGTSTNSILKQRLDSWYESNLANYIKYIDINAGFCNDRMPYTDNKGTTSGGGIGSTYTWYAAFIRLYNGMSSNNASPSFKCTNTNDLFTVNNSSKGNKVLNYPIGTITADEVSYAGGVFDKDNTNYYLYNELGYWTMSPWLKSSTGYACIFAVYSTGRMMNGRTRLDTYGVRPVINLRADVTLTGSGTSTDPYVVEGAA